MNQRMIYENAYQIANHCVMALVNVLTDEEQIAAKECLFEICREGLETYELQVDRMHRRLRPLQN